MWLALAGVAALLKANPLVFHAVQYLCGLPGGWASASRTPKHEGGDAGPIRMQPGRYFQQAILVSLLNPKAILFYMASPAAVHRSEGAPGHRDLRGPGRHHPGGQHRLLLDADRRATWPAAG